MAKQFRNFFVSELLVILAVTAVFRLVSERLLAGAIAGALFVALGVWISSRGIKQPWFRKTPTFFLSLLHLFGSALPLAITRFANSASLFQDVRVLGLPGPVFHQVSTGIYSLLMIATVFDWIRFARASKVSGS